MRCSAQRMWPGRRDVNRHHLQSTQWSTILETIWYDTTANGYRNDEQVNGHKHVHHATIQRCTVQGILCAPCVDASSSQRWRRLEQVRAMGQAKPKGASCTSVLGTPSNSSSEENSCSTSTSTLPWPGRRDVEMSTASAHHSPFQLQWPEPAPAWGSLQTARPGKQHGSHPHPLERRLANSATTGPAPMRGGRLAWHGAFDKHHAAAATNMGWGTCAPV